MSAPVLPFADDCPWPIDTSCCADWDDYSDEVRARAQGLAGRTLFALTAGRVGGCPITVRPCKQAMCQPGILSYYATGGYFMPVNYAGSWYNCACQFSCGCLGAAALRLPAPIGRVDAVMVDGMTLDPSDYRVEGDQLIRQDGYTWPLTQNVTLPLTEPGTFGVTYLNAFPVDDHGAYAGGVLACEYAKACSGGKCRLPSGVTAIVRQGVSMTISTGAFPEWRTGIREVDTFLAIYNPNSRRQQSRVWSP